MKLITEIMIRWHRWRMEKTYGTDRQKCRYHAYRMAELCRGRNGR